MAKFLNEEGLKYFAQKTKINIVSQIDGDSTNSQIPGAKAVYDLLTDAVAGITKLEMRVVDSLPSVGEGNVIYLVEADPDTYKQWVYTGGKWFDLGDVDIDLSGYWAKDELEAMTNQEIQDVLDEVMGA
jgi:hypothetical protein